MATTPASGERASSSRDSASYPAEGSGWVLFAGIMIMMVGVLNIIWGIAAIDKSCVLRPGHEVHLQRPQAPGAGSCSCSAALQLAAAFSIWAGGGYGRWFGIATATVNAIAALLSIPAYPFWALAIFAVDVLVIYGLAAYGGDRRIAAS